MTLQTDYAAARRSLNTICKQILTYDSTAVAAQSASKSMWQEQNLKTFSTLMRVWMGGSGFHYSLKKKSIIHLIKMLAYSLKFIPLFIKNCKLYF